MKETLIRRTRSLWVAVVVVLVAGAAGTTTAAATPTAQTSALTAKQKKAKKRALKKCKKQKRAKKRKACMKKVNRKYQRIARNGGKQTPVVPNGKTYDVDVMDDYYQPAALSLKPGDWIAWSWRFSTSREGHNVTLNKPTPKGVAVGDFQSSTMSGPGGQWKRQFKYPGTYNLYCTLHVGMTMTVRVDG